LAVIPNFVIETLLSYSDADKNIITNYKPKMIARDNVVQRK